MSKSKYKGRPTCFENKNFVRLVTLAWELIPLDIGPSADTSKLGSAIHNS